MWLRQGGAVSGIYTLELTLADGSSLSNIYIDEGTCDRDLSALAIPASYRVA